MRLRRTKPRLWAGNGMGYYPASYELINDDGETVATVEHLNLWGWQATFTNGQTVRKDKLADLRKEIAT